MHFLRCLTLSIFMSLPLAVLAEPSAIYLVRHAEKGSVGKDPDLTAAGQSRAQTIGTMLQHAGIAHIFSSPYARTRQTALPLAERSGLSTQTYDPSAPQALVEKVKALSGAVLVVGHSNTLPELVRLFGGSPGRDIADHEYDRVYLLVPKAGGAVQTILLTSPPASPVQP